MTNQTTMQKSTKYDLTDRTALFGERVIEFTKALPKNEVMRPLISQIVRSGTSVGANYMEADGAESKKDFWRKLAICRKEAKETKHWLRMIAFAHPPAQVSSRILWDEAQQLTLIFSSILNKVKQV